MRRTSIAIGALIGVLLAVALPSLGETAFSLITWNIQGYPEATQMNRIWFTDSIEDYEPTILCIQEIANLTNVNDFVDTEYVTSSAFVDSSSEFDNAIFTDSDFTLWNVFGVYHRILYRDGSTPVDVDCLRRGCGSWGRRSLTARF